MVGFLIFSIPTSETVEVGAPKVSESTINAVKSDAGAVTQQVMDGTEDIVIKASLEHGVLVRLVPIWLLLCRDPTRTFTAKHYNSVKQRQYEQSQLQELTALQTHGGQAQDSHTAQWCASRPNSGANAGAAAGTMTEACNYHNLIAAG